MVAVGGEAEKVALSLVRVNVLRRFGGLNSLVTVSILTSVFNHLVLALINTVGTKETIFAP